MNRKKLYITLLLGLVISSGYAQESANASGGDASGSGGSVAYTIGQVAYTFESGSNGNTSQGVQYPYEIYLVSIDEGLAGISLITYPNPTSDYLTLKLVDYSDEAIEYQLIDINGKIILNHSINHAQTRIDLNAYSAGTYFIKVIKESQEIKTFKIIKN